MQVISQESYPTLRKFPRVSLRPSKHSIFVATDRGSRDNYTGRGLITKSRVGESDRFCDAENESGRRIFPARQVFE